MKKRFREILTSYKNAILPTIVITIIFFINYFFFGLDNTMIGPFATLSFLRFRKSNNYYGSIIRHFLVYVLMAVFAFIAVINLPLCILINLAALGWIGYFLIDEYDPTNYFPPGMALMFFQIASINTPVQLLNRIVALAVSFLVIFVFVVILSRKKEKKDETVKNYIRECFINCDKQLVSCRLNNNGALSVLQNELFELNRACSMEIYHFNRASIRFREKINWYCRFIVFFQIFNYLTIHREEEGNIERATALLEKYHYMFQTTTPPSNFKRLTFRSYKLDIRNFRFRFALRLMLVVTPCFLFAYITGFTNAYWLVISVFFMMIPFSDETLNRVSQRLTGTIAGIIISFILFSVFRNFSERIVIMTIANFFIYTANSYSALVTYITCSALALQSLDQSVEILLAQRLIYTIIGAGIAILANKLIFPIRQKKQVDFLIDILASIRIKLFDISQNEAVDVHKRRREKDRLIIKSYMISKRIETLNASFNSEVYNEIWESEKKKHMKFLAEYFAKYLLN